MGNFLRRYSEFLSIGLVLLVIFIFFAKPILGGLPVSKLFLLSHRDLLFSQFQNLSQYIRSDASLYLLAAPNFFTVAQCWREGIIPLWNPYVGMGFPEVGDLQSCIFSPWRMLAALNPTVAYYNLQLFFQIGFASIGAYLLCRFLGLHKLSSIFVALIFPLSPYLLRYLELLGGPIYTMYPWLFLAFLNAAKRPTLMYMTFAAATTALLIFTGHTLLALAGIMAASLLFLSFSVFVYGNAETRKTDSLKAIWRLGIIGVFAFILASPVLFPFVELMKNTYCYKFNMVRTCSPWATCFYMLTHPGVGEWSAFIGVLAIPLFVCGLFSRDEKRKMFLAICPALICIYLMMAPIPPFANLIDLTPLRMIPSAYFSYVFLLLFALCAGIGVEYLMDSGIDSRKRLKIIFSVLAVVIFLPLLIKILNLDLTGLTFDEQLVVKGLHSKFWVVDLIVCSLFSVALALQHFKKLDARVLACAAVVLCLISELNVSRLSLPVTPKFDFIETEAHRFFQEKQERVSPQGFDLLAANSNAVYGIRSLALHNPMLPKRYINFIAAAHAHIDDFNILIVNSPVSRLFDIASLKYIIAFTNVLSDDESWKPEYTAMNSERHAFGNDLILERADLLFNPGKREIVGKLFWKSNAADKERYNFLVDVLDENGASLWYSGLQPCFMSFEEAKKYRFNLDAFLPKNILPGQRFTVAVKVFDNRKAGFITNLKAKSTELRGQRSDVLPLVSWTLPTGRTEKSNDRFRVVKELQSPNARIYENNSAFPQAYLVPNVIAATSSKDSENKLAKGDIDFADTAIVELDKDMVSPLRGADYQLFAQPLRASQSTKSLMEKLLERKVKVSGRERSAKSVKLHKSNQRVSQPVATVSRPNVNKVEVSSDSADASFLVLSDLYYPGWTAKVDGVQVPIYCANHAFRGVPLEPGKHEVVFVFEPASFWTGAKLALALLIIVLFTWLFARKNLTSFGIE
ncbi:MAG: hypothetical protein C0507_24350 [Cyanobacteria bacterium PR.3.49]|nr:hypothetical protein [Cyanobacteria bacterium PR.3.49]